MLTPHSLERNGAPAYLYQGYHWYSPFIVNAMSYLLLLTPGILLRLFLAGSAGVADLKSVGKDLWRAGSFFISPVSQRKGV